MSRIIIINRLFSINRPPSSWNTAVVVEGKGKAMAEWLFPEERKSWMRFLMAISAQSCDRSYPKLAPLSLLLSGAPYSLIQSVLLNTYLTSLPSKGRQIIFVFIDSLVSHSPTVSTFARGGKIDRSAARVKWRVCVCACCDQAVVESIEKKDLPAAIRGR